MKKHILKKPALFLLTVALLVVAFSSVALGGASADEDALFSFEEETALPDSEVAEVIAPALPVQPPALLENLAEEQTDEGAETPDDATLFQQEPEEINAAEEAADEEEATVQALEEEAQPPLATISAGPVVSFQDGLTRLYALAESYIPTDLGFDGTNINTSSAAWLTFAYIRQFNASYTTTSWNQTAGSIANDAGAKPGGFGFIAYVQANDADVHSYFATTTQVHDMDVRHMAAAITSFMYNATTATPMLGMAMTEAQYDDLSGWAGDLQTFTMYIANANPTGTQEEYREYAKTNMGQPGTTFDALDMAADADARNFYNLLAGGTAFADAASTYYSTGIDTRYTAFAQTVAAGAPLAYTTQQYTTPPPLSAQSSWPLYLQAGATISAVQSAGIAQGFEDYLSELALYETVYTVSFETDGGSAVNDTTNVRHNATIGEPAQPQKTGYAFGGWYKESGLINQWNFAVDTVQNTMTLYAKWTENADTQYKAEHYRMSLGGSYELFETEILYGATNAAVQAAAKAYTGFVENTAAPGRIASGVVAADGSTVLKLYYDRQSYSVNFFDSAGANLGAQTVKYGEFALPPAPPNVPGKVFTGWRIENSKKQVVQDKFSSYVVSADTDFHAYYAYALSGSSQFIENTDVVDVDKALLSSYIANAPYAASFGGMSIYMHDFTLYTIEDFSAPAAGGATFTIPYPNETVAKNPSGYYFAVLHLGGAEKTPELLQYEASAAGLFVTVDSFSPFAIGYKAKPAAPAPVVVAATTAVGGAPKTGDTTNVILWLVIVIACVAALIVVLLVRKKKLEKNSQSKADDPDTDKKGDA